MAAAFSVPARLPRSCPPPRISGSAKVNALLAPDQRAGALGTADLVRAERHQVGAECIDVERHATRRLHGIDMQHAAVAMDDLGCFANRLNDAGLVVRGHQRDEDALSAKAFQTLIKRREIDRAASVDRNFLDIGRIEPPAGEHRGMLDRRNQKPFEPSLVARCLDGGRQRQRVRLGSTRREDHVARIGAGQRRDVLARLLDHLPRRAPFAVHRGRIAGKVQRDVKSLARFRSQRCARIPVQINAPGH